MEDVLAQAEQDNEPKPEPKVVKVPMLPTDEQPAAAEKAMQPAISNEASQTTVPSETKADDAKQLPVIVSPQPAAEEASAAKSVEPEQAHDTTRSAS